MTEAQGEKYSLLARGVDAGHISMNKAYLLAKKSFSNANGGHEDGFRGSIGDWITDAKESGWIDKELVEQDSSKDIIESPLPSKKGNSMRVVKIAIGVIAVMVLVNHLGNDKN